MTDWQATKRHNLIATRRRKKAPNAHGAKLTFVAEGREAEFTLMLRKGFLDDLTVDGVEGAMVALAMVGMMDSNGMVWYDVKV